MLVEENFFCDYFYAIYKVSEKNSQSIIRILIPTLIGLFENDLYFHSREQPFPEEHFKLQIWSSSHI